MHIIAHHYTSAVQIFCCEVTCPLLRHEQNNTHHYFACMLAFIMILMIPIYMYFRQYLQSNHLQNFYYHEVNLMH
jgi:hypothetical protein